MRTWRVFLPLLIVGFVMFSALADRRAPQHVFTGTVTQFHAGEWMPVADEKTTPAGLPGRLARNDSF
jgi:hypothetical protein